MKSQLLIATTVTMITSHLTADEVKLPTIDLVGQERDLLHTIPGSATLLDTAMIEAAAPLSLQDMLRKTAGIHAVETDGYGFYPRIAIRGIGSDMSKKVLLLEDGAPIALGPYTDPAAYYHPPVERMERIEVLKGSGSLLNGPSTIGGTINYQTKQPRDGLSTAFHVGNFGYSSVLVDYGIEENDKSFGLSVLKKEGEGWRAMPFDATDAVLKGALHLSENQTLGVKLTHYKHEAAHTYLGLTQAEYEKNYTQNKAKNDVMYLNRSSADVTHEYFGASGLSIKTLGYYNRAVRDWWREGFTLSGAENVMTGMEQGRLRTFEVAGLESRAEKDFDLLGTENSFEGGIKLHRETMHNRRTNDGTVRSHTITQPLKEDDLRSAHAVTLFGQNVLRMGNTAVIPGLRAEYYTQQRDITTWNSLSVNSSTVTKNIELIPGIGVTQQINDALTLFAGVHRGFAPPRVQDAVSNDGTAVNLDAERSTNYELGMRAGYEKAQYEVTLFRLDFENQIVQATESGGAGTQNTNAGKTRNQGAEFSGTLTLGTGIRLGANYTYLPEAKLTSTRIIAGTDRNGNRLTYAPEHLANLTVTMERASWGATLGYHYVSAQFADLENTQEASIDGKKGIIPAYGLWNLNGWYVLNKNAKLTVSAKNIWDEKYIASRAPEGIMPGMGLHIQAGLKVKF